MRYGHTRWLSFLFCIFFSMSGHVWAQSVEDLLGGERSADTVASGSKSISLESNDSKDAAILKRLQDIYRNLGGLQGINVEVNAGVVTIKGELLSKAEEQEALSLAKQVDGVVEVENQLTQIHDINVRILHTIDILIERFYGLISFSPILVMAILVVVAFWLLARFLLRWDRLFSSLSRNKFIIDLIKQATLSAFVITGILLALEILDATALLGSIIGAAGLIGLAISFAIRDTVENYIASVLLSLRQPFAPNDHILINEFEGKVIRLTSRATILMTFDGNHVRVPNAIVYKGILINYTRNPERRFHFELGVDTGVDLTAARSLAIKTMLETTGVLDTPAPSCQIDTLGDSNVVLSVYGWTDQRQYEFLKVRSACIQAIKEAYDAADFEMPEPIYRLRLEGIEENAIIPAISQASTEAADHKKLKQPGILKEHVTEALDVRKDTDLDETIAEEAATETDLLNETVPKE